MSRQCLDTTVGIQKHKRNKMDCLGFIKKTTLSWRFRVITQKRQYLYTWTLPSEKGMNYLYTWTLPTANGLNYIRSGSRLGHCRTCHFHCNRTAGPARAATSCTWPRIHRCPSPSCYHPHKGYQQCCSSCHQPPLCSYHGRLVEL